MASSIAAHARQPRGIIKLNGQPAPWTAWQTDTNSNYQANTFRADFVISGLPQGLDLATLSGLPQIEVEIFAGLPSDTQGYTAADLESVFFGRADDMEVDLSGRKLTLTGRDLTGALIDGKTSEKYPNLTASQIAETLASKHGLTPVVTATSTKAGTFYQIDSVRVQDEQTEWDLLTWLAREEHFTCFVKGKELHFEPADAAGGVYQLRWSPPTSDSLAQANAMRIVLNRSLTLAKDITVEVKSWNAKNKKPFVRTAKATKTRNPVTAGAGKSASPPQTYSYTYAGLTPDQAQLRAQAILADLSKHELRLEFDGPAEDGLGQSDTIQLSGTGTSFDTTYFPDSIVRSMSMDEGYTWRVAAKNHDPSSQPAL